MNKPIIADFIYYDVNEIINDDIFEVSMLVCKNYTIDEISFFTEDSKYFFDIINSELESQDKIFKDVYYDLENFIDFLLHYKDDKYKELYSIINTSLDLSYNYICSYDNIALKELTIPKEHILMTCVNLGEQIYNLANSKDTPSNISFKINELLLNFISTYGFPSFEFDYVNLFNPEFKIKIKDLKDIFIYIYKLFEIYNLLSLNNDYTSDVPECVKDWIYYSKYDASCSIDEHISKYLHEFADIIDMHINSSIKYVYNKNDGIFELKVFNTDMITYAFYELSKLFQYKTTNLRRCKVCSKLFLGTRKTSCICDHCRKYEYEAYKKRLQRNRLKIEKLTKEVK